MSRSSPKLHPRQKNFEQLVDGIEDLVFVLGGDGRILYVNSAVAHRTGFTRAELRGKSLLDLHPHEQAGEAGKLLAAALAGRTSVVCSIPLRCKDGRLIPVETWAGKGSWSGQAVVFAVARDTSERLRHEAELLEKAITDELTGLYNRRHFFERAAQELVKSMRGQGPSTIAMLDMDHFKNINDSFGHAVGDRVLAEFAILMKRTLRPYDIVARYGGEEFAVFFRDIERQGAARVLNRVRAKLANRGMRKVSPHLTVTFSGGLADTNEFDLDSLSVDQVLKLADERLYQAKYHGRNRLVT
jgi:diguanylate cyclase (GGDEF)-like protein/PAS domain S-box-containing protein